MGRHPAAEPRISARPRAATNTRYVLTQRGTKRTDGSSPRVLGFSLLLRGLEVLAQDRSDLTLHERPRDGRVGQRALLATGTVNLKTKPDFSTKLSLNTHHIEKAGKIDEGLADLFMLALTSDPCCLLIESREQGKQNLWCPWLGHCTKCVSSRRSWHSVHLSSGAGGCAGSAPSFASVDDTDVVDDTCREPDDRRPPFDPVGRDQWLATVCYVPYGGNLNKYGGMFAGQQTVAGPDGHKRSSGAARHRTPA